METHEHGYEESREPGRRPTAYYFRRRFEWLNRFSDEELKKIDLCTEDEPLRAGEQYFDISHPERGIISGETGQRVPDGACYVARASVTPAIWAKLVGGFSPRNAAT